MMDSTGALNLEDIPGSLLVVGGGYIGPELVRCMPRRKPAFTVVRCCPAWLPVRIAIWFFRYTRRLEKMFEPILLNTTVASLKEERLRNSVLRSKALQYRKKIATKFLIAFSFRGTQPNSEIPGLEKNASRVNSRGFYRGEQAIANPDPSIYAIGDVVGEPMLAHQGFA